MRELGPDRLSEDGRFLILRDPTTRESFRLPADPRLTSLIDASHRVRKGTTGTLEPTMESTLSPRDIQARIRRGETPAQVAEAAGVPPKQIEGFAAPVLAEREFMGEQARRTTIRRKHVGGAGMLLGALVDERLSETGSVPEDAEWDAWRREDGRWTVVVRNAPGADAATFLFDVKSRYVLPVDDAAHDLVGDVALPDSGDMAIADALRTGEADAGPTRAADPLVEEADLEVSDLDDAAPDTSAHDAEEEGALFAVEDVEPAGARVSSLKEARDRKALEQLALGEEDTEDVDAPESAAERQVRLEHERLLREDEGHVAVPDTVAPRKKKHERRRVPSWDEIMFGGRDD